MPKEKKAPPPEEGAPAWMLTYGDMVTLILTFFVLLVSIMVIDPKKFVEVLGTYEKMTGEGDNRVTRDDPQKTEDYFMQIIRVAARRSEVLEGGESVTQEGEATRVFAFEENYVTTMTERPFFNRFEVTLTPTAKRNLEMLAKKLEKRAGGHVIRIIGHYAQEESNLEQLFESVETSRGTERVLVRPFERKRVGPSLGFGDDQALEEVTRYLSEPSDLATLRAKAVKEFLMSKGLQAASLVTQTGGAITKDRVYRAKGADAVTFRKRGKQTVADLDKDGNIVSEKVDILRGTAEAGSSEIRKEIDGSVLRPWQQFIFVDRGGDEGRLVEIVVTGQLAN